VNLNNNILLIILGVIGLGLSLFCGGGLGVLTMFPGSRENLKQIQEMMNIVGWSSIFSAAMIGFGIYNNWRR
jgi:hypothetical protein